MSRLKLLPYRDLAQIAEMAGFSGFDAKAATTLFERQMAVWSSSPIMAAKISCVPSSATRG